MNNNTKVQSLAKLAMVALISLLVSSICVRLTEYPDHQYDMITGWSAGMLFHLLGLVIFRHAIGRPGLSFLAFSVGFILFRLFVLIILVVIVLMEAFLQPEPFIAGLLPAYFIGSWMEIAGLAATGNRRFYSGKSG